MSGAVIAGRLVSYLPTIFLVLSATAIVIGVPLAYRYWRELHEDDEPIQKADLLADLERGGAASKMTEDEFHRVRELLLGAGAARKAPDKSKRIVRVERVEREEKDRESRSDVANE
jgi:hypothetical protein